MAGISTGVYIVLFIFYFIFLWVVNHKLFTFIYFDIGKGLLKEFLTYFFLALILVAVTVVLWWLAAIILAIFGLIAISKCDTKNKKIAVAIVFGVLIILISIVGINSKNNSPKKQKNASTEVSLEDSFDTDNQNEAIDYDSVAETKSEYIEETAETIQETSAETVSNILRLATGNYVATENGIPSKLLVLTVNPDNTMSGNLTWNQSEAPYRISLTAFIPGDYPVRGILNHNDRLVEYDLYLKLDDQGNEYIYLETTNAQDSADNALTGNYYPTELQQLDMLNTESSESPLDLADSSFIIPDSNSRYLTEEELQEYTYDELRFALNEIYARHGRIFASPELKEYFEAQEWYEPTVSGDNFDESVFNDFELDNIKVISKVKDSKAG